MVTHLALLIYLRQCGITSDFTDILNIKIIFGGNTSDFTDILISKTKVDGNTNILNPISIVGGNTSDFTDILMSKTIVVVLHLILLTYLYLKQ